MTRAISTDHSDENNGINKVILSDQVRQYILDSIERGELLPGDRLVESQLARQLRVSQAPVREAIRDLVSSGVLVREPHKGTMVRMLTEQDMREIYKIRAVLDALAAEEAAPKITDGQIKLLYKVLEKMSRMAKAKDYISAARYDWQIHTLIVEFSGNRMLQRIYDTLQLGQYILITMRRSSISLEELADRHRAVIEALETRDPEAAKTAMQQHIIGLQTESVGDTSRT